MKKSLHIVPYLYNDSMPDFWPNDQRGICSTCKGTYIKDNLFWITALVTCNICLPFVSKREHEIRENTLRDLRRIEEIQEEYY